MGIKNQISRFHYDQDAVFSGSIINRGRPLKFRFANKDIFGFEGDTILSALLANGINAVGETQHGPIALTPSFCPPIEIKGSSGKNLVMPMDRTPAIDGLNASLFTPNELERSSKKTTFFQSLFGRKSISLDVDLAEENALRNLGIGQKPDQTKQFDLVVIGGGVAGLSAVAIALKNDLKVALLEQQTVLGGDAKFFGALEGEERPNAFVSKLRYEIEGHANFSLFLNTEVISLNSRYARGHKIVASDGQLISQVIDFSADNFVLAPGLLERLPIFDGNRLPGVCGAKTAFMLAAKYGVWPGKSLAFCTSASAATQVTLFATDMGVEVKKLSDSRANPKSRFFEFAKAYGISLATGTQVLEAQIGNESKLNVQFGLTGDLQTPTGVPLEVDRLVVCGGWQPNLNLWHMAGGQTIWNSKQQQLQASGYQNNIHLAGACCGAHSMTECQLSGSNAVLKMLALAPNNESFAVKKEEFESDDGWLPVANPNPESKNCYLDFGYSLNQPEVKPRTGFWKQLISLGEKKKDSFLDTNNENTLGDIVAKAVLGEIPEQFAGLISQERCGVRTELLETEEFQPPKHTSIKRQKGTLPSYLPGRFGKNPRIIKLKLSDNSSVEPGCLIYKNHEPSPPTFAVGVVFEVNQNEPNLTLAYVDGEEVQRGNQVVVRHGTHTTTAMVN